MHNLGDVPTQLAILKELKQQGRVRYIGVTTTFEQQYAELDRASCGTSRSTSSASTTRSTTARSRTTILPLAQERKIGVLCYAPFGRTRLFGSRRRASRCPSGPRSSTPTTWAQFFLKFVASHPAITAVTPATSQAKNMIDNLGGGRGRLPDAAMRKRMIATSTPFRRAASR